MLLNLWVKNLLNGIVHQVGTNFNDSLELIDGKVEYVNIETKGSTRDGTYTFIESPNDDTEIYFSDAELVRVFNHVHKTINKDNKRKKK